MSLTQHLHTRGLLRAWWMRHSAGLQPYLAQIQRQATTLTRHLSRRGVEHAAAVGAIVGRVIETWVEPAPPYAAILGAGTRADATLWPTHAPLLEGSSAAAAVEWRPTPAGWQHLVPATDVGTHSADLAEVARIETNPKATDVDRAAAAGAIAALEMAYRSRQQPRPLTPEATADAVAILRHQRRALQCARQLCGGRITGHAAPVFAPHWADGDVLLGPGRTGGYGLVDVKTVGGPTLADAERVRPWLWQLLSYAAADATEDLWRVRAIGLWLPRQDALVMWPVADIWAALGVDPTELEVLLQRLYLQDYHTNG